MPLLRLCYVILFTDSYFSALSSEGILFSFCDSMRLWKKALSYATVGGVLAGVTSVLLRGPEEVKRQITSNGIVRVGRAATVVSLIWRVYITCNQTDLMEFSFNI